MKCSNCGKENASGVRFCAECGSVMPQEPVQPQTPVQPQAPVQFQTSVQAQVPVQNFAQQPQGNGNVPFEYKPISMWGYFGYELLFAIPCVGFILLLIFSFGGTSNQNLKNFARSYFCFIIVIAVLVVIFLLTGGAALISSYGRWY